MTRDYVNETCRNLEFDYKFLEYVSNWRNRTDLDKRGKKPSKKGHFANGVLLQQYLMFKIICTMPDDTLVSENIQDRYGKFLGKSINQPSAIRALFALDTIGLIDFINNPFDKRQKKVKLTKEGKKMQYLFTGSTKPYSSMDTAINQFRYHANVNKNRKLEIVK